jgi:hypothetical protein
MNQCPTWQGRCFRCGVDNPNHGRSECPMLKLLVPQLKINDSCVTCALPVFVFGATAHKGQGSMGRSCTYKDTVVPLAMLLYQTNRDWVTGFAGRALETAAAYGTWLASTTDGVSQAGHLVAAWVEQLK